MDILTAARAYVFADLVAVPTRLKTKRPVGRWRGVTETPQSVLETWPTAPDIGVGLLTGPSRLVVVDLDVKSRDTTTGTLIDGVANWSALLARLGLSAFTPQETTPSGGQHVYFWAQDDRPLKTGVGAKVGIDIRGDGGFIVCAPTAGYEFTAGITPDNFASKIYTMPPALVDHFSKPASSADQPFKSPVDIRRLVVARERTRDPKAAVDSLLHDLSIGNVPGGSAPGNQAQAIFWTACRIWELEPYLSGLADAAYPDLLAVAAALQASGDPWTEESIMPTWQSARRTAEESPLIVPDENELAQEDDLPWTDIGNAERLRLRLTRRGTPALYSAGSWLVWDGKRWSRDTMNEVGTAAVSVATALKQLADIAIAEALAEAGPKEHVEGEANDAYSERRSAGKQAVAEAHELKDWAKWSGSARGVKAMQELLSSLPGMRARPEGFDHDPALLNVANGTLNLRDSTIRPHDPADRITKLIPIRYAPDASALRWTQFLSEVFSDPELPAYYQRLIGYGITGLTTEQCLIVQHGKGANGKTVGAEVLRHVFADYALVTSFDTFEEKRTGGNASPEIVRLKGARLAFASEGSNGGRLAEAAVKRLTGDEHITARELYKGPVTFKPEALIILSTNHLPEIQGADDGIWRRVRLIPWSVQFSPDRQDPLLAERLKRDESEGILAWAVAGAASWFSGGLQHPASVVTAGTDYRGAQDALSGFLPGILVKDDDSRLSLSDAYLAYVMWADSEGLQKGDVWTKRAFQRAMESRSVPTVPGAANKRYLLGVRKARKDDTAPAVDNPF
jgi:P4 family phage/plasmid primase-like protien